MVKKPKGLQIKKGCMSKNVQSDASRDGINEIGKSLSSLTVTVNYIQRNVDVINSKLDADYVTRETFDAKIALLDAKYAPTTKYIWGLLSVAGAIVVTAVLGLILRVQP